MIWIQNIYHMLAYAFQILREQGYANCGTEEVKNTADLLSAILAKGVTVQIKRDLGRTYIEETEPLSCLRGKIDVTESIKRQTVIKQQLVCTYDEFSVDSYMNRILKTTMELLLGHDIPKARKKELRNLLLYFKDVEMIDVYSINWSFRFNRNNQSYQMLMSVCYHDLSGYALTQPDRPDVSDRHVVIKAGCPIRSSDPIPFCSCSPQSRSGCICSANLHPSLDCSP